MANTENVQNCSLNLFQGDNLQFLRKRKRQTRVHRRHKRSDTTFTFRPFDDFYKFPPHEKRTKTKKTKPIAKPEIDEQSDLINDEFFFKQIRRSKQLEEHPLKHEVEVFNVDSKLKDFENETVEEVEEEEDDSMSGEIPNTTEKNENFEFIQEPTKLDKNSKYYALWDGDIETFSEEDEECHECERSEKKRPTQVRLDAKKVIDEFMTRILRRRQ